MSKGSVAPATIHGLRVCPCDPLILCINLDGQPLRGLAAEVDWRLAGSISQLALRGFDRDLPILRPAHEHLPAGRLVLFRSGACTPTDMAEIVNGLNGDKPGICPEDFDFSEEEVLRVFRNHVVIYRRGES
jgi:hypothetical protein